MRTQSTLLGLIWIQIQIHSTHVKGGLVPTIHEELLILTFHLTIMHQPLYTYL